MIEISWKQFCQLGDKFGDSFYVLDLERFERNFTSFLSAFRAIYPRASLGYSYKTNYTAALCRRAYELGARAEVVSRMEYDLALQLGVPANRIIFNGPIKTAEDLQAALTGGAIVNLDSHEEVSALKEIAGRCPERRFEVGLRCRFDLGDGRHSRFGFDAEGDELAAVFREVENVANGSVVGLHVHYSALRDADSYARRARKIVASSRSLFLDRPPRYLDLGGGFCGPMSEELRRQFAIDVPSYGDYAAAIGPIFAEAFPGADRPELILEPGVALLADVMQFVARVVAIKSVGGRCVAVTAGSYQNMKPALNDVNLPVRVYRREEVSVGEDLSAPVDFVGYTCMESDVLHAGYAGRVEVGDYAVFDNVGAYSVVFKPPFIRAAPAIVSLDRPSGEWRVVRRPETLADVVRTHMDVLSESEWDDVQSPGRQMGSRGIGRGRGSEPVNLLLSCVGRRGYIADYFRPHLGEGGQIVGTSNSPWTPGFSACDAGVLVPDVSSEGYVEHLLELCGRHRIHGLLSFFDQDVDVLSGHREAFEAAGVVPMIPSRRVSEICFDKFETYQFLKKHDLSTPETFIDPGEAREALAAGRLAFPVVVKPRRGFASRNLFVAHDEAQLASFFAVAPDMIVQEMLAGQEGSFDILSGLDQEVLAVVFKQKVAMRAGETDQAETRHDAELIDFGQKLGRALGNVGPLDVDVFRHEGRVSVLELNPRFGGGYPSSHLAGADFPRMIVSMIRGESPNPRIGDYRAGVIMMKDYRILGGARTELFGRFEGTSPGPEADE